MDVWLGGQNGAEGFCLGEMVWLPFQLYEKTIALGNIFVRGVIWGAT